MTQARFDKLMDTCLPSEFRGDWNTYHTIKAVELTIIFFALFELLHRFGKYVGRMIKFPLVACFAVDVLMQIQGLIQHTTGLGKDSKVVLYVTAFARVFFDVRIVFFYQMLRMQRVHIYTTVHSGEDAEEGLEKLKWHKVYTAIYIMCFVASLVPTIFI